MLRWRGNGDRDKQIDVRRFGHPETTKPRALSRAGLCAVHVMAGFCEKRSL
jgi:hypothetical protein